MSLNPDPPSALASSPVDPGSRVIGASLATWNPIALVVEWATGAGDYSRRLRPTKLWLMIRAVNYGVAS